MANLLRRFTRNSAGGQGTLDGGSVPAPQSHEEGDRPETLFSDPDPEVNQLGSEQLQQMTPHLGVDTSGSSPIANSLEGGTPTLANNFNDLKALQSRIPTIFPKFVKEPESSLFRGFPLDTIILPIIDEKLEYCMILLHDTGHNETSLKDLARRLQQKLRNCLFILLRGPEKIRHAGKQNTGYGWNKTDNEDEDFRSCSFLLEKVIYRRLVNKCEFKPRNIVFLGHGQGAAVALSAVTIWNDIEFAGVIAVGNPSLFQTQISNDESASKGTAKTPVLVVGSGLEKQNDSAVDFLRDRFSFVDVSERLTKHEDPPDGLCDTSSSENKNKEIVDVDKYIYFLAHRLRQDEWKKQDIISFDGGGIRGYGSLLILEALMEKIMDEEKSQDQTLPQEKWAKSSFHPVDFMPTKARDSQQNDPKLKFSSPGRTDSCRIVADRFDDHPKSARFLPCHYFTYAAGTSTGGLISIMIHRLRMPIDKCISEYEKLGKMVFGRPRPPILNKISPKFNHKYLEDAINEVCDRHGEASKLQELNYVTSLKTWPEKDALCKCMVLAISHIGDTRKLYPFRTYQTPPAPSANNRAAQETQRAKGYGDPSYLPIWKVGRATSAAPQYFEPITIEKKDEADQIFKDGGFGYNNPSLEMYNDMVHKHKEKNIGVFVSIGTGVTEINVEAARNHIRDSLSNLMTAIKLPTMTGPAHRQMEYNCKGNTAFHYVRLDGGKDLGKIALDEWKSHKLTRSSNEQHKAGSKTLDKIRFAVRIYLGQPSVQKELKMLAKCLVDRRRLRIRDLSQWDRFASFSFYICDFEKYGCEQESRTADDFRKHLKTDHFVISKEEVEEQVLQRRRYDWVYR